MQGVIIWKQIASHEFLNHLIQENPSPAANDLFNLHRKILRKNVRGPSDQAPVETDKV